MNRFALVGNPNTGKTSLFNQLCGTKQRVGNYPGVTVEKKTGSCRITENATVEIVDLPGIYSLSAMSPDERVTLSVLEGDQESVGTPDAVIIVLEAGRLQRNLYLFSQLAELEIPGVIALTMADSLEKEGISLDIDALKKETGLDVIPIHGSEAGPINELKKSMAKILTEPKTPNPNQGFSKELDADARSLQSEALGRKLTLFSARELLFQASNSRKFSNKGAALIDKWQKREKKKTELPIIRYEWAQKVVARVEKRSHVKQSLTNKIDKVATHPVAGLGIFFFIMGFMFQSIYSGAGPVMDVIDAGFGTLSEFASTHLTDYPLLSSLISDGIIGGVGSVLIFLPQIIILFLIIAFLEDSGYLSRAAFLMDKLLGWTGMSGRSFIPLLSSFACAIPAILSARVIADMRTRLTTILVTPLVSCSARLPVYVLMIGTFIEPVYGALWAGLSLFFFHALGLIIALPLAWLINKGKLTPAKTPFLLELPPYRLPMLKNIWWRTYEAAKKFTLKAGTIIFALSIILWALATFPQNNDPQVDEATKLEQSYLGRIGHTIQPAFDPLGFDWKISIGIVSAFPAREVIISTLGILYRTGEDEDSTLLRESMRSSVKEDGSPVFTPAVAISLMIFFALCSQCMSTLAIIQRELNSIKWPIFVFSYMTALAYAISFAFYKLKGLFI